MTRSEARGKLLVIVVGGILLSLRSSCPLLQSSFAPAVVRSSLPLPSTPASPPPPMSHWELCLACTMAIHMTTLKGSVNEPVPNIPLKALFRQAWRTTVRKGARRWVKTRDPVVSGVRKKERDWPTRKGLKPNMPLRTVEMEAAERVDSYERVVSYSDRRYAAVASLLALRSEWSSLRSSCP